MGDGSFCHYCRRSHCICDIVHVSFWEGDRFLTCGTFGSTETDSAIWSVFEDMHVNTHIKRTNDTRFDREPYTGECPDSCTEALQPSAARPRVVISVRGGVVTGIYSDVEDLDAVIVDWDRVGNFNERDEREGDIAYGEHVVSISDMVEATRTEVGKYDQEGH